MIDLRLGDCLDVMATLPAESVDAVVCDPPYEISFMSRKWDGTGIAFQVATWQAVYRVLKPGGYLLAFGGTRTYHRMTVAIEDAGFEIRDCLQWIYGSGFPKSHDISKAIDRMAGAEREVGTTSPNVRPFSNRGNGLAHGEYGKVWDITAPATEAARQWEGFGTALKPSYEPVVMARKPLSEASVAANVLKWGTGAINIDASRISCDDKAKFPAGVVSQTEHTYGGGGGLYEDRPRTPDTFPSGRWPANILLSHSPSCNGVCAEDCPVAELDSQSSASRFFYVAKASRRERNQGCEGLPERGGIAGALTARGNTNPVCQSCGGSRIDRGSGQCLCANPEWKAENKQQSNTHPTVKPVQLCRYLVKMVCPPGGVVLDPFMGSGSTGVAAIEEGFGFVGIEREGDYLQIAQARIEAAAAVPRQVEMAV